MVLSCKKEEVSITGEFADNIYINKFFEFKAELPEGWHAQDDETRKKLMLQGQNMIAGKDPNLNSLLESGQLNSASLFMFAKFPLGTPTDFNPNILALAENVKRHSDDIKTGKDYFRHVKKGMRQGKMAAEFSESQKKFHLGKDEFDIMDIVLEFGNSIIHQRYYCLIKNGYAVSIILSSINDEQRNELLKVMETFEPL